MSLRLQGALYDPSDHRIFTIITFSHVQHVNNVLIMSMSTTSNMTNLSFMSTMSATCNHISHYPPCPSSSASKRNRPKVLLTSSNVRMSNSTLWTLFVKGGWREYPSNMKLFVCKNGRGGVHSAPGAPFLEWNGTTFLICCKWFFILVQKNSEEQLKYTMYDQNAEL